MNKEGLNDAKKILPLGVNSIIKSYSYHAHFFSIVEDCGIYDAEISHVGCRFNDTLDYCYNINDDNCDSALTRNDNFISFQLSPYNKKGFYSCYYNTSVKGDGSFIININSIKSINPWTKVGIKLYDFESDKELLFTINGEKYIISEINNYKDNNNNLERLKKVPFYSWLKLTKIKNKVLLYFSEDGVTWSCLKKCNAELTNEFLIGILIQQGENNFEKWFYNNYIQLCYSDSKLDFFTGYSQGYYDKYVTCPYIIINDFNRDMIKDLTFQKFLIKCIDNGNYVRLVLKDTKTTDCLVYGYDLKNELFHLYLFDQEPPLVTISIDNLDKSKICKQIYIMSRIYPWEFISTDIDIMIKFLEDYLYSNNSYKFNYYMIDNVIYGIEVYNMAYQNICKYKDDSIFTILYSHKVIMKNRIKFLYNEGTLPLNKYEILYEAFNKLESHIMHIKNMFLDYLHTGNEMKLNDIRNLLLNVIDFEKYYIKELIKELKKRV